MKGALTMQITAIGACDDFHMASRWAEPRGGIDEMVKIRLQGTTNELKRMRRVIERNRCLKVISVSEVFANKGTKKYFRQYMDVSFDPKKSTEQ